MALTTSYTRGVKYIKVSRFDANGVDQTDQLQNITNIRMLFSDYINPIDYPAVSITEYPDYYLYTIVPTDVTSSVDNEILNYQVSSSGASNISDITPAGYLGPKIYQVNNFFIPHPGSNPLGYFNNITGTWTLGKTPNIVLHVTASVIFNTLGGAATYNFSLSPTNGSNYPYSGGDISKSISILGAGTHIVTLSGSITPVENTSYNLLLRPDNVFSTIDSFGSVGGYFIVTQSITPYASPGTTLTVLEPYIDDKFKGSDCDVLQNNVILNSPNSFYMVVDYSNGSIIAENQQAILSGSATRAQIQNWNYTYASQINGRYVGKEQNAIAYNVYTSASQFITESAFGFTGSWPGDTTSPPLNGDTVIRYLDSCIYTTNWGGGGYPENANGGIFNMNSILLVGSDKDDVTEISQTDVSYFDILSKNIPFGTEFYIKQYDPSSNNTFKATSLYPGVNVGDAVYWVPSNYVDLQSAPQTSVGLFYPTGSGSISQPFIRLFKQGFSGNFCFLPIATRIDGIQQITPAFSGGEFTSDFSRYTGTVVREISSSLVSGSNPWFISLYNGYGPTTSSISAPSQKGLPPSTDGLPNVYQMGYPFEVFDIKYNDSFLIAPSISGSWDIFCKNMPSNLFTGTTGSNPIPIGGAGTAFSSSIETPYYYGIYWKAPYYGIGMILTQGTPSSNYITSYLPSPPNAWSKFSNIKPGYITTPYPTSVINQKANYITKTYGNNPNP